MSGQRPSMASYGANNNSIDCPATGQERKTSCQLPGKKEEGFQFSEGDMWNELEEF